MISTDRLDYALPADLIAQRPAERRDGSRLLVVDRQTRAISHRVFGEVPEFLRAGDTLLRNNAAVLPARLLGRMASGGKLECLLLRKAGESPAGGETWQCLLRPGRRLPAGAAFEAGDGALAGRVIEVLADGSALVQLVTRGGEPVADAANRVGEVPLPPYIERSGDSLRGEDRERYQTVYADPARQVAVAAPTAGLHFTPSLLEAIRARGVAMADLTLHVGLGTFRPIATDTVEAHRIHGEPYEMPADTQRALFPPSWGAESPWGRRRPARSRIFSRTTGRPWNAPTGPRRPCSSIRRDRSGASTRSSPTFTSPARPFSALSPPSSRPDRRRA